MTLHLELDPKTEAKLADQAKSEGGDLNATAQRILRVALDEQAELFKLVDPKTALAALDALAKIAPPVNNPALESCTWPRSMIYDDDRY